MASAANCSAAHFLDDLENYRGAAFERVAADAFVGLMRLLEIAGAANQRLDPRMGERAAVGTVERSPGGRCARYFEQRSFERRAARREHLRGDLRIVERDRRAMVGRAV